jgi:hypothetical protein
LIPIEAISIELHHVLFRRKSPYFEVAEIPPMKPFFSGSWGLDRREHPGSTAG